MCNNSGQLFVHMFVYRSKQFTLMYGTRPWSGPPAHAFGSINTNSLRPHCPCPDCTRGKYNTGFKVYLKVYFYILESGPI